MSGLMDEADIAVAMNAPIMILHDSVPIVLGSW